MSVYTDEKGSQHPERRKYVELRGVFDDVVRRVEPFFKEGGSLNGNRPDYWVAKSIQDAYPDLSNEEVQVLTAAASRYYRERG